MASPSTVITLGYGSFGSVNLVPTLGYGSGAAAVVGDFFISTHSATGDDYTKSAAGDDYSKSAATDDYTKGGGKA